MIKGIIFDMDGVLFDTEPFYLRRREDFFKTKGIPIDHLNSKDFIGGNLQELWKELLGKNRDDAIVKAITTDYDAYKQAHKPPYQKLLITEVNSCLEQLKKQGIKLAVASNSKRQDVLLALETTQIKDYFEIILAREDVSRGKPYPDIYNKAVQKLGLQKKQLLVVEDSQKGIAAAKAANLTVFAITDYRYGIDQSQADHKINHLGQLCVKIGCFGS
ncbi:haloacid dehalogenase-like hydrolase [Streptococcus pyogenes]|uniref:HAD family hydrolase n=1 Tax=Streptococcus pyogenes TaxID=1314 RepID=UPI0010EDDFA9|nr:HAD family phosphatase [Streptococcus pyogenes]VHM58834.1 haloacid dehalogenase-like hydrolase [Streptococcus pyogenes]